MADPDTIQLIRAAKRNRQRRPSLGAGSTTGEAFVPPGKVWPFEGQAFPPQTRQDLSRYVTPLTGRPFTDAPQRASQAGWDPLLAFPYTTKEQLSKFVTPVQDLKPFDPSFGELESAGSTRAQGFDEPLFDLSQLKIPLSVQPFFGEAMKEGPSFVPSETLEEVQRQAQIAIARLSEAAIANIQGEFPDSADEFFRNLPTRLKGGPETGSGIAGSFLGAFGTLGVSQPPLSENEERSFLIALTSQIPGGAGLAPFMRYAPSYIRTTAPAARNRVIDNFRVGLKEIASGRGIFKANRVIDPDPVMQAPAFPAVAPPESAKFIGMGPVEPGISRLDDAENLARSALGGDFELGIKHEMVTPIFKDRAEVHRTIVSQASVFTEKHTVSLKGAFDFTDTQRITDLDGVSPNINGAPTIQDVAAKLPDYWDALSPEQKTAMRTLELDIAPYHKMQIDAGIEIGHRPDIVPGGFYIPRGNAVNEGADLPKALSRGRKPGKGGHRKTTTFDTNADGINAGWEYASIDEVLDAYARKSGSLTLDATDGNYMKALRGADGRLLGVTPAQLIPDSLRNRVTKLKRQIAGRVKTARNQTARAKVLSRDALRSDRAVAEAAERVGGGLRRKQEAQINYTSDDLVVARAENSKAFTAAGNLAAEYRANAQALTNSGRKLTVAEKRANKAAIDLEVAVAKAKQDADLLTEPGLLDAEGIRADYDRHMREADRFNVRVEKLSKPYDEIAGKTEELMGKGELLKDMKQENRAAFITTRQNIRAMTQKGTSLAVAERELRTLKLEYRRLVRASEGSNRRLGINNARADRTLREIESFEEQLESISKEWDRAIERSKTPPEGFSEIALTGLEQRFFPNELANAANTILRAEQGLAPRTGIEQTLHHLNRAAAPLNNMFRGLNATGDLSFTMIQGLLGLADNQKAWGTAMRIALKSLGPGGDKVFGKYLLGFDATRQQQGRLTSSQLVSTGVKIVTGGDIGEFAIGGGLSGRIGRLPVIRQANRSFGYFGNIMRLEWADDMILNELKTRQGLSNINIRTGASSDIGREVREGLQAARNMNISAEDIIKDMEQSGDLRRIAEIANNMTGYSQRRTGGDLGELLLFAPRFLQSRLETVGKAALSLRPGASLDQTIARRSMLKMIGYGTGLTVAINEMMGNETDFDLVKNGKPNPNFMRIRAFGRDWSLFGTWDSLLKSVILTAQGKPHEVARQMPSAITRLSWDFVSGSTAIGERTRDNASQVAYTFTKAFLPFVADETVSIGKQVAEGEFVSAGATIVGEVAGAKSSPFGLNDTRSIVSQEMFGVNFDEEDDEGRLILDRDQRRQVNADERVKELAEKFEERKVPANVQQTTTRAFDNLERIHTKLESILRENIDDGMNGENLRKAIQGFKRERFSTSDKLLSDEVVQEGLERDVSLPLKDVLAEEYWSVDTEKDRVTGVLDFDFRDNQRADILAKADELGVSRKYITDRGEGTYRGERFDDPVVRAVVEGYEDDMERVHEYYNTTRIEFEKYGLGDLYLDFIGSTDPHFTITNPLAKLPILEAEAEREDMRREDPVLDRILWIWGFPGDPKSLEVMLAVEALESKGTPSAEFDRRQLAPAR